MATLKVLYVDDDPDIREVAALSLELDGDIEVRTADGGLEALRALDEGFEPDVIMLDVMMPGMDGPSTLKEIRGRPRLERTPVVFITARTMASEHAEYLAQGLKGVMVKPFDPMTLAMRLRDLVEDA